MVQENKVVMDKWSMQSCRSEFSFKYDLIVEYFVESTATMVTTVPRNEHVSSSTIYAEHVCLIINYPDRGDMYCTVRIYMVLYHHHHAFTNLSLLVALLFHPVNVNGMVVYWYLPYHRVGTIPPPQGTELW